MADQIESVAEDRFEGTLEGLLRTGLYGAVMLHSVQLFELFVGHGL
jgi:hypothetical protein